MLLPSDNRPPDDAAAPLVVVVNEAFVDRFFKDRDPLLEVIGLHRLIWKVIGVVRNTAHDHRGSVAPKVYQSHAQFADNRNWELTQLISTTTDRSDILDIARRELAAIDPLLVLHDQRSMRDVMGTATARETFAFLLMCVFGGVALLLAAAGIYGVLAYSVSQRTREIGIRVALGADARSARSLVAKHAALITGLGIVLGLAGAFALSWVLGSLLFNVGVKDPLTFTVAPIALALVAWLAAYVPARRASCVDPMEAIRYE